jgi:hypothetical protein
MPTLGVALLFVLCDKQADEFIFLTSKTREFSNGILREWDSSLNDLIGTNFWK